LFSGSLLGVETLGTSSNAADVYKSMSAFKVSKPEDNATEQVIRSIVDGTTQK